MYSNKRNIILKTTASIVILLIIVLIIASSLYTEETLKKYTASKTLIACVKEIKKETLSDENMQVKDEKHMQLKESKELEAVTTVKESSNNNASSTTTKVANNSTQNNSKQNSTNSSKQNSTQNSSKQNNTQSSSKSKSTSSNSNSTSSKKTTSSKSTTQSSIPSSYKGYSAIGKIEIPKTGVNFSILSQVSVGGMEVAPCFLYTTGALNKSGNSMIVGHNYNNIFSKNKNLEKGDKIYITTLDGKKVSYTIYSKFRTTSDEVDYLARKIGDKPEITLSTCTESDTYRLVILAVAD